MRSRLRVAVVRGCGSRGRSPESSLASSFVLVHNQCCVSAVSDRRFECSLDFGEHRAGGCRRRLHPGRRTSSGAGARRRAARQPGHGGEGVPGPPAARRGGDGRPPRRPDPVPPGRRRGALGAAPAGAGRRARPVRGRAGHPVAAAAGAAPARDRRVDRAAGRLRDRRRHAGARRCRASPPRGRRRAGRRRGRDRHRGHARRRGAGAQRPVTARRRGGGRGSPAGPTCFDLLAALDLRAVPVAVDDDGPVPGALAAAVRGGAKAAVVTVRAQNPTGAALGAAVRPLRAVWPEVPGPPCAWPSASSTWSASSPACRSSVRPW